MKSIGILLIIIAALLCLIFWKLGQVQSALEASGRDLQAESIVASNHDTIGAMQKLQASFDGLRQEIADFREKLRK